MLIALDDTRLAVEWSKTFTGNNASPVIGACCIVPLTCGESSYKAGCRWRSSLPFKWPANSLPGLTTKLQDAKLKVVVTREPLAVEEIVSVASGVWAQTVGDAVAGVKGALTVVEPLLPRVPVPDSSVEGSGASTLSHCASGDAILVVCCLGGSSCASEKLNACTARQEPSGSTMSKMGDGSALTGTWTNRCCNFGACRATGILGAPQDVLSGDGGLPPSASRGATKPSSCRWMTSMPLRELRKAASAFAMPSVLPAGSKLSSGMRRMSSAS
jgi:hypothetical protein